MRLGQVPPLLSLFAAGQATEGVQLIGGPAGVLTSEAFEQYGVVSRVVIDQRRDLVGDVVRAHDFLRCNAG